MQALTVKIKVKDSQGRVIEHKEVATYAGLLTRAHEEGLKSIVTELVQVPTAGNKFVAIAKAEVTTKRGVYHGIGDASPENVNKKISLHIIRMAETRAKARALRDAVDIGMVSLEELGGEEGDASVSLTDADLEATNGRDRPPVRREPATRDDRARPAEGDDRRRATDSNGERPPAPMTDNQRRFIFRILAGEGYDGTAASMRLCDAAGVERLQDITKAKASSLIDEWTGREAANGR